MSTDKKENAPTKAELAKAKKDAAAEAKKTKTINLKKDASETTPPVTPTSSNKNEEGKEKPEQPKPEIPVATEQTNDSKVADPVITEQEEILNKPFVVQFADGDIVEIKSVSEHPDLLQGRTFKEVYINEAQDLRPLFVIPYLKSAAAGHELLYALRSIQNSFPDARVVVIGDKEDYFTEEITHLQHEPESDNPQIDVAHKLLLGISSGVIKGEFILTNDDIFLLGKTEIEDIRTLKATGVLDFNVGRSGGVYNQNAINTLSALTADYENAPERAGRLVYKYGTHTPVCLDAETLVLVIERFNADETGHLITTLYFNELYGDARPILIDGGRQDPILASVYKKDVPKDILENAIAKRKFMNVNDDGYKCVEPYLEKLFPDKSKFEK